MRRRVQVVGVAALYELWLSNNEIGDEGARALFAAFASGAMANLGDLRLQYNRVGDAGLTALTDVLSRGALANLWYLGLSDNAFGDGGLQRLQMSLLCGALPRLEFLTASGGARTTAAAEQNVQDVFTQRPRPRRPGGAANAKPTAPATTTVVAA